MWSPSASVSGLDLASGTYFTVARILARCRIHGFWIHGGFLKIPGWGVPRIDQDYGLLGSILGARVYEPPHVRAVGVLLEADCGYGCLTSLAATPSYCCYNGVLGCVAGLLLDCCDTFYA